MNELRYRLFWTKPFRQWMVRLSGQRWLPRRSQDWIVDQLYPDNCTVTFLPKEQ